MPLREGRHRRVANIGKIPASYDPLRAAFYVSYDANSLATLKKHYKDLDLVVPEELHAVTPDGGLTIVDYERYQTVKASPEEAISIIRDDKLHQWMHSRERGNSDHGDAEQLRRPDLAYPGNGADAGQSHGARQPDP